MKLFFDKEQNKWIEKDCEGSIYLDGILKQKLDNIKMILKKKWDAPIMIDGLEGSGKTTLGMTIAWYLGNTNFTKENICKSAKDTMQKLQIFSEESVLLLDEGDLAFSSKDVFVKEQKDLIKLMKVIRFRRLILIVIAPSFFDLNKYISVHRTRFLLHVYTSSNMERGRFAYFGTKGKKILYEVGKKNYSSYSKPRANFYGRFIDFNPLGEEYNEAKEEIVKGLIEEPERISRFKIQRDYLIKIMIRKLKLSEISVVGLLKDCDFPLQKSQISDICLGN